MTAHTRAPSSAALLAQAAEWRLHALLLSRPTSERKLEVRALAQELNAPALSAAAQAWCDNASEGAYLHLLGPGGIVPAREAAYRAFADPGWLLADIARYHEAFAFHPAAEEPPDHIATLIEFAAYLSLKEAFAAESGNADAVDATRSARERFIAEHIVPVVARLAVRLDECGATEWSATPHLLAAQLPGPASTDVPVPDDDTPPCGACLT